MRRATVTAPTKFEKLVRWVATEHGMPVSHVRAVLASFSKALAHDVWATGRIVVPGLATFNVRDVAARDHGLNDTMVPAHRVVKVRAAASWRRRA